MKETVEKAIQKLESGGFVMIYDSDSREKETDLVTPSSKITPRKINRLRNDAGGLICVTIPPRTWKKIGLPYLQDLLQDCRNEYPLLERMKADDIPYDERSTFSLTVNHRDTFTGITDRDRAKTIHRFAEMAQEMDGLREERAEEMFGREFRTPGHVFLLNASEGLLDKRQGHTELTTALLELGELYPSMTICEMLSSEGGSMSEKECIDYGKEHDIPMVEGKDIMEAWKEHG